MNVANGPNARDEHATAWTGTRMLVWGGYSPISPTTPNTGASYDPVGNAWTQLSTVAAPQGRYGVMSVWTGSRFIVWGGADRDTGGVYDPSDDTWAAMSTANAPAGRNQAALVWTGSKMIVWGGFSSTPKNTGARYTPSL
jgi:N-acetylneuraminic acid mutarotase